MRLIDCFVEIMAYTIHFAKATGGAPPYETVAGRYDALITRSKEFRVDGHFAEDDWKAAFFAVCCWVDETILCSDWMDKGKWQDRQLQRRFFGTSNGGDEFFSRLASFSDRDREVREVYGSCLALGFKGRFFDAEGEKELAEMKRSNFDVVQGDSEFVNRLFLFPAAYGTETKKKERSVGIYILMFAAAVLPVAGFAALYFFYGNVLDGMVIKYFR